MKFKFGLVVLYAVVGATNLLVARGKYGTLNMAAGLVFAGLALLFLCANLWARHSSKKSTGKSPR